MNEYGEVVANRSEAAMSRGVLQWQCAGVDGKGVYVILHRPDEGAG